MRYRAPAPGGDRQPPIRPHPDVEVRLHQMFLSIQAQTQPQAAHGGYFISSIGK